MPMTVDPDNTLTELDLALYAKKDVIKALRIQEVAEGFILLIHLTWRTEDLYLSTRRDRDQPKCFKTLQPLLELLRTYVPGITSVTLDLRPAESLTPPAPRRRGRQRASPDHPHREGIPRSGSESGAK